MKMLLNGHPPDASLADSRALHYGDGVFRTLLVWKGQPLDWPLHLEKLRSDCSRLDLNLPDAALLQREVQSLIQTASAQAGGTGGEGTSCVLKLILSRRALSRGYAPGTDECDRLLLCDAAPRYPASHWDQGIAAMRSPVQLGAQPRLAGIKHLNRLEQVLASRDWPAGVAESLMCNEAGQPICGTRSNLFWVSDGALHTPALERCGVAGMMRGKLLALAAKLGIPVHITTHNWSALETAGEAFITNALIGLWPLRLLEQHRWHAPGPVTRQLMDALKQPRLTA